ncbi:MAG: fatty acid oxidation complex subunit alpha FadB, partial [Proteobacteria bacterium]|nr:fatty acid oxidation complex subunit alpha FadB [Pseudomonadota bacterium]
SRDDALKVEYKNFVKVAMSDVTKNLVSIFLADQYLKKEAKKSQKIANKVKRGAVLGAGIMGGGISYQSASRGIPVVMKDIQEDALELGLNEATKLLNKQVSRGKMDTLKMAGILTSINPTLSYESLSNVDIVVEAVVENEKIKSSVIKELEEVLSEDTIIASNTSTISISKLSEGMKAPGRFVGMHFFNPVHRMPLVEVIRGAKSSDEAVATTVAYAQKIGKTPIVVNDCPGFLVNRVLFPYFAGFNYLINEGGDFVQIDKIMESFGWPMGPAYLYDVVGMDTGYHAAAVMADGFPDRLKVDQRTVIDVMYENKAFGQKTGSGFYKYELDKKGRSKKVLDPSIYEKIKTVGGDLKEFDAEKVINFMMLPMLFESSRCLEDKIVATPQEVDMGLIYGLGFPPFRGGIFRYADTIGLPKICEDAKSFSHLGKLYEPTEQINSMLQSGAKFYND